MGIFILQKWFNEGIRWFIITPVLHKALSSVLRGRKRWLAKTTHHFELVDADWLKQSSEQEDR